MSTVQSIGTYIPPLHLQVSLIPLTALGYSVKDGSHLTVGTSFQHWWIAFYPAFGTAMQWVGTGKFIKNTDTNLREFIRSLGNNSMPPEITRMQIEL